MYEWTRRPRNLIQYNAIERVVFEHMGFCFVMRVIGFWLIVLTIATYAKGEYFSALFCVSLFLIVLIIIHLFRWNETKECKALEMEIEAQEV